MIQKLRSNPEAIHVASGYKEIGDSLKINRERIAITALNVSKSDTDKVLSRIDNIVSDKVVTVAEKDSLSREYDAITRDFDILKSETRDADLGDSDEFYNTNEAFKTLASLFEKIINSKGDYVGEDVQYLSVYYKDYSEKANILESKILAVTTENSKINDYYAKTKIYVNATPQAVPVNDESVVSLSVLFDGREVVNYINADDVSFGVTGLATPPQTGWSIDDWITVDTTRYPQATVTYQALTNSVIIEKAKEFSIKYEAISEDGIIPKCLIVLDIDSMPF